MRSLLYGLLNISEGDMEKWMIEKSWGGIIIDLILMFGGGIIVGVALIKILSELKISPDGKYMKYILIIILNLVVFAIYYVLHAQLMDEYMGEIFDYLFEDPGEDVQVSVFSEDGAKAVEELKKAEIRVEKPKWWKGLTIFMGGKPMVSI